MAPALFRRPLTGIAVTGGNQGGRKGGGGLRPQRQRLLTLGFFLCFLLCLSGCWWQERVAAGVMLEGKAVGGWTRHQVEEHVRDLARREPGLQVDETVEAVLAAEPGARLRAVRRPLKVLAAYATCLLDRDPDRVHNIRLTVERLNGHVILPGEVFSFNAVVGQPTAAAGFRPATVLGDDGRKLKELGGGMCQVSSTLYNVALGAGFKVLERHPHAKPVKYVPPGRDATIYTDLDLKFQNNSGRPVTIRGAVGKERVRLWFLG